MLKSSYYKISLVGFLISIGIFPSNSLCAQTTVTLYPDKDAVIVDVNETTNYGTDVSLACARMTNTGVTFTARGLIDFDLSSIPNGAIISSATLTLYGVNHFIADQPTDAYLERIIEPWVESQVAWRDQPARSDTATKISLAAATTTNQDYAIDVKDIIQDMINNPGVFHGLMLRQQDEVDPYRRLLFASSDNSNSARHPKLSITYESFIVNHTIQHVDPATSAAGSITLSPQNGSTPYTYLWSTGDTVSTVDDLLPGIYTVDVTDSTNKVAHLTLEVHSLVEWQDLVGVTASSGELTKTASTAWGNAGAYSVDHLLPFSNGALHYEVDTLDTEIMIGLAEGNPDANYTSIDYAFYLKAPSTLEIYEEGTNKGSFGSFAKGDELVIERKNEYIYYKKNGFEVRSVSTDEAKFLNADAAIKNMGNKVNVVYVTYGGIRLSHYATLQKKLDGGCYFTNNKKMRVYYLEEYYHDADTWEYTVYDDTRSVASVTPTPVNKNSGDNWFELDVSGLTYGNYYVLEVTNDKNEKSYLRFVRRVSPGFSVERPDDAAAQ